MDKEISLVSIIVRTKDRPQLVKTALESIARQSYRPIEIVLVNDGGCDLNTEEIEIILSDIAFNYVRLENNSGRAHAGNVGIENANGEYIGFLDDDDEYYPDHIETLVTQLRRGDYPIAYTAVDFIEKTLDDDRLQSANTKKLVFSRNFSYDELIISNYIPLMSLLFRATFLKSLKFDESFELYEDWDMLIRAGALTPFHFINSITAVYNQWSNSQIAFKSPQEIIRRETLKLYRKHREKMPLERIFDLREENARKDKVIADKDEHIDKMETQINDLEKALNEKEHYIQTIQSGLGWKLLAKSVNLKNSILRLIR